MRDGYIQDTNRLEKTHWGQSLGHGIIVINNRIAGFGQGCSQTALWVIAVCCFTVGPCLKMAYPDVISIVLVWLSGSLPCNVIPGKPRSHSVSKRFGTLNDRHNATSMTGPFEAAIIPLCSNSHTRPSPWLHPPSKLKVFRAAGTFTR